MEKYDFGPAAQYLFRPCELDDDFFDQVRTTIWWIVSLSSICLLTTFTHDCESDGKTGCSEPNSN